MKKCATCYRDPAIRHWHDPQKVSPRGTSESNWICESCTKREVNWDWRATPNAEIYGIEHEDGDDASADAESAPGPYETELCIQIMKLWCSGSGRKAIAKALDCDEYYARETISYWRRHRGYFVEELRAMLSKVQ